MAEISKPPMAGDLFGHADAVGPRYACGCPCVRTRRQPDRDMTRYHRFCPEHGEPYQAGRNQPGSLVLIPAPTNHA